MSAFHVLICMLAAYLIWHLREALALTFTDEPIDRHGPVTPATRSVTAQRRASHITTTDGYRACSYPALLDHLATLTRNDICYRTNGPLLPHPDHPHRHHAHTSSRPHPAHPHLTHPVDTTNTPQTTTTTAAQPSKTAPGELNFGLTSAGSWPAVDAGGCLVCSTSVR